MPGFRRAVTLEPPGMPFSAGLTSLSACDESVGQPGCHPPSPLRRLALLLTRHGTAASWSDGMALTHRPGCLVAVGAGVIYEERLPAGAWWHLSYLLLSGSWCDPLNQALRRRPGGVLIVDQAPPAMRNLLVASVEGVLAQAEGWAWPALASLAGLIGELLARTAASDDSLPGRIAQLVDQRPQHAWTVDQLARHLELPRATLIRRFIQEAGIAPATWIRRRRIDHARRLLAQDLPVSMVAERLGFANPYHFSRVFKAVAGMPPSHARAISQASPLHGS